MRLGRKERGKRGRVMTNREWLESLSDEKLAKFYATQSTICEMCDYTDVCISNITSEKCSEGVVRWLQAEHKEPKKEFTQDQLKKVFRDKFMERRAIGILEIEELIGELFK